MLPGSIQKDLSTLDGGLDPQRSKLKGIILRSGTWIRKKTPPTEDKGCMVSKYGKVLVEIN